MKHARLEQSIGHCFVQPELLNQALTHRSHSSPHNERLEFLGDGVINCVVATLLYQRFPALREGELSRLRANLVRQETLAALANRLGLSDLLRLGEGELNSGGFRRPSILADAMEAVIGAVYLDGGFARAREVIAALYHEHLEGINPLDTGKDAKTALQEWLQGRRLPVPHYELKATRGAAHAQEFEVVCAVTELNILETGRGASRRGAEQQAAQSVLDRLKVA